MPLTRAQLSKNKSKYGKNPVAKEISKKTGELDSICEKHNIGKLTFKSCKLSTAEGAITFVDYEEIKSNMRASAMIIKVNSLTESANMVYDIVQLEKAKKERDLKKKEEEAQKVKPEIDRLKKLSEDTNKVEGSDEHKKLLEKMVKEEDDIIDEIGVETEKNISIEEQKDMVNEPTEVEANPKESMEEPQTAENNDEPKKDNSKGKKRNKSVKAKREQAIKRMNDTLMQKASQKEVGNKYYRNFMKDLKSKFSIECKDKFKYLEVKAETTDMVIDNARIYQINMPPKTTNMYLLVVGDLQLKSKLMYQIDPNYKSEKVFEEHNEFLERIKAKENAKIKESAEDLLDEEFDELEELGISDEENDNSSGAVSSEKINDLLTPELVKLQEEEKSQ